MTDEIDYNKSPDGLCHICEKQMNEAKLTEIDELWLCEKDLAIYKEGHWLLFQKAVSDPDNPIGGLALYKLRGQLTKKGFPCFLKSSYETDDSESKVFTTIYLFCRETDFDKINNIDLN